MLFQLQNMFDVEASRINEFVDSSNLHVQIKFFDFITVFKLSK